MIRPRHFGITTTGPPVATSLRGESHELKPVDGLRSSLRRRALTPSSCLPQGIIHLPTLFVAHRFVSLQVDVTSEAARLAVRNWVPFLAGDRIRQRASSPWERATQEILLTGGPRSRAHGLR